jgi:hypothetical protein
MDYSMFGAMLPQQAREEDMRSRMVNPNTFAQLNPLQQIVALGGNAGAMVGGAVGNMMGGRIAKEAEGAMIKEVFDKASQVSEDPAEQYAFASREFRRLGMNDRAMALEDRAGGLAEKRDTRNATVAAIESRTRALLAKDPNMNPEVAQSLAQDPAAFREAMKDSKIKYSSDVEEISAELFGKPFNQLSPTEAGQVNQLKQQRGVKKATAGASRIVNMPGTAENEYAKKVGAETATQDVTLINSVKNAPQSIKKLEETLDLIDKGQLNTGIASGLQDTIARARSKFLADKAAKVNVADSQYLDSLLGSDVFAQIQALGIGARGLDTPAEREFLLSVVTGTRALDKETLRRMTQFRLDAVRSSAEAYNDRIKNGELEQYQRITGRQLKPVELSSAKGGQQLFPNAPPVGTVKNGFRYNGGDPAQPTSWSKK